MLFWSGDEFTHGVCFVQLAPISNSDLVPSIIAHTLGLRENNDQSPMERLQTFLCDKHLLLIIDNFEQVLPAAPLLTRLLSLCPLLKMVVTSRSKLRLEGEHEFAVKPLALPDFRHPSSAYAISHIPSVMLFTRRAQAVQPHFILTENNAQVVAEICVRLDGLPLALELAAARIQLLTPQQRFYLLNVIREFGMEKLRASSELEPTRTAHASHYLQLFEESSEALAESRQVAWLELLKPELENIRATLLFLQECHEAEAALKLAASLQLFWMQSGYMSEGRHFLEHEVEISRDGNTSVSVNVVAQALYTAGWLAYWQNVTDRAASLFAESEHLRQSLGNKKGLAATLHYQGNIAFDRGDKETATAKHIASLRLYKEIGDDSEIAKVLLAMGTHALYCGNTLGGWTNHDPGSDNQCWCERG